MKKVLVLSFLFLSLTACNSAPPTVAVNESANAAAIHNQAQTVAGHSSEKSFPPGQMPVAAPSIVPRAESKTKWTQSGNPIDTTAFDAGIAKAEKALKAKATDETAKKTLAAAYVDRAKALTDARQYASALGDYRKALKLDQNNPDAKEWIDKIISIYDSINREYPPEGEEPPALPFNKDAETKKTAL